MREIIKKRKLHVNGMTCGGCEDIINTELADLDGIKKVKADRKGIVNVEYDLMKVNLDTIEQKIAELGYEPSAGFFNRITNSWRSYTEQNEYDNMHHIPRSCCTLPGDMERL